MRCSARFVFVGAIALSASFTSAQNGSTFVDAKSNIFGYGTGTPQPGGGGGGLAAVVVDLDPGVGRTASFGATGTAWWGAIPGSNGPDGGTFSASTSIPAVGPISGFTAPLTGHLVGLFIEAGDISALSAPANISYPDAASFTNASYSPGVRQVFFIGDGLTGTGSGSTQTFNVPDGASKLVLGIADAFGFFNPAGYYDDNIGGYEVEYAVVPGPATGALLGVGAMALMRRRR